MHPVPWYDTAVTDLLFVPSAGRSLRHGQCGLVVGQRVCTGPAWQDPEPSHLAVLSTVTARAGSGLLAWLFTSCPVSITRQDEDWRWFCVGQGLCSGQPWMEGRSVGAGGAGAICLPHLRGPAQLKG